MKLTGLDKSSAKWHFSGKGLNNDASISPCLVQFLQTIPNPFDYYSYCMN